MNVEVFDSAEDLAQGAAGWFLERIRATQGRATVCLSGGSTPRLLYQALARPPVCETFPWDRVHWFWGDERFVPSDDARSNYRMACDALLGQVPVPAANVHPIPTGGMPEEAATAYEQTLKRHYGAPALGAGRPLFDVAFLGLGEDGHTASLFPGTAALDETLRWAVAVRGAMPEPRITLTYPVLASSRDVAFLVAGAAKRQILARVWQGEDFPATRIRPAGRLTWFVDRAARGKD